MIQLDDLVVSYESNGETVTAVRNVDLAIDEGERIVLTGPSGSGKSSLLAALAGLIVPTEGSIRLDDGANLAAMSADGRARFRRQRVAMLLQGYDLLDGLTVQENLDLVAKIVGDRADSKWTDYCVERLGISPLLRRAGHELSGGQRQRAAMCRCLSMRAPLMLIDEPTSALDHANAEVVAELLEEIDGATIVAVTHDPAFALSGATRMVLRDGSLVASA